MTRIMLAAILATGGALLLVASQADAYTLLTPNRAWATLPVPIEIHTGRDETSIGAPDLDFGQTATADKIDSLDSWNGKIPGITDAFTTSVSYSLGDGAPTVVFNDPLAICTGSCLAATLTGYYSFDGVKYTIDDADIFVTKKASTKFDSEIEKPPGTCTSAFYIEGIMVHEVGHMLGLGHSATSTATMYSTVSTCDSGLRILDTDDKNGIDVLY